MSENDLGFIPSKDAKKNVITNLDAIVASFQPLPVAEQTAEGLERLPIATYALSERPHVSFLRVLPEFKGGKADLDSSSQLGREQILTLIFEMIGIDVFYSLPS